jgi:hypothetical protein
MNPSQKNKSIFDDGRLSGWNGNRSCLTIGIGIISAQIRVTRSGARRAIVYLPWTVILKTAEAAQILGATFFTVEVCNVVILTFWGDFFTKPI